MLTLFLGPDDFSKKEYAKQLALKEKAQLEFFAAPEQLPMDQMTSQDLFGGKKIFIIQDGLKLLDEKKLPAIIQTTNKIIFFEEKVDRRGKFNKDLIANKEISVKEFALPHGRELNAWLADQFRKQNGKASQEALEALAIKLGRDEAVETKFGGKVVEVREIFNLWQGENEVKKLAAFSSGREVTPADVATLTSENYEPDVLKIVNAIGDGKKQLAWELMESFLREQSAADEKGKIIQLNALLSEQFRNIAIVQDFLNRYTPEQEILGHTGWKTGRLFVMKKLAANFQQKNVLATLSKLSSLDEELKSATTPPRVLLHLITAQLFAQRL